MIVPCERLEPSSSSRKVTLARKLPAANIQLGGEVGACDGDIRYDLR